jgi:hypothetical protein
MHARLCALLPLPMATGLVHPIGDGRA